MSSQVFSRKVFRSFAVIVSLFALAAPVRGDTPQYMAELLGPAIHVGDMNEFGEIVGWTSVGSYSRGYVAGPDHPYELLPLPAGYASSRAYDNNDAGEVVGAVGTGFSPEWGYAVVWRPDGAGGWTIEFLGALPPLLPRSIATSINNRGDIIGYVTNTSIQGGETVWFNSPSGVLNIEWPYGAPDQPWDLNDEGQMTGSTAFTFQCFDIDTLSGDFLPMPDTWGFAYCYAINNHGELAGFTAPPPLRWATRYTNDGGWEMMSGIGNESAQIASYDINDEGTVIMEVGTSVRTYMNGFGVLVLNDLISPQAGNWLMLQNLGGAVNNQNEFGVIALNLDTDESGVAILTPIVTQIPGDIDGDGAVDMTDVGMFVNVLCGWDTDPGRMSSSDLNGDGVADGGDVGLFVGLMTGE